ncbi:MAG: hypothetical protein J6Y02_04795 [Pseudobutyrivibrio sp.]|nr:hypothetical protein [Pseudobutyrivibrio sp.]
MKQSTFVRNLKEASSCIRKFEAESKTLKDDLAKANEKIASREKDAEALKLAMQLILDDKSIQDVMEKFAILKEKDLKVVKEAMELDLTKMASLGEVCDRDSETASMDPVKAFMSVLRQNR